MKTLIAFETKSGVTGESAKIIAEVLEKKFKHAVDIADLKENRSPDIESYDTIFVGSGIRMGRWYGNTKKLLKNDFKGKNLILFVSACSAGDSEKHDEAVNNYMGETLKKLPHLKPFACEAFGGRMKMLFGIIRVDNYDPEKVRTWAVEIGERLSKHNCKQ